MDPFTVAIILIIVGAVLLIIEAFSPGAFMLSSPGPSSSSWA